jgi:hypothetical protein
MRSCERAVHQPVSRSSGLPTDTAACRGRIAQPIESVIPAESSCWPAAGVPTRSPSPDAGSTSGDGACLVAHGGPPRTASKALAGARVASRWPSAPLDPARGPRPGGGADQPAHIRRNGMSGGIGTCKNQTCMQTDMLLEDGYCSDDCRLEATGCSVPGCRCLGADDGVSRCSHCQRYTWGVVAGHCPDCRSAPEPAASTGTRL